MSFYVFYSAVIFILAAGPHVRELMLAAFDKGLIDGEHTFFSIYPFNNRIIFGDDSWKQVTYSLVSDIILDMNYKNRNWIAIL